MDVMADASGEWVSKTASAKEGTWSGQEPALESSTFEQEYTAFCKPKSALSIAC